MAREYRLQLFTPSKPIALKVGTSPLGHNHLDAPPLAQRHLHGDQLEGREEHLGLTGHAGKGDVRQ